jgi:hypothetical protein
MKFVHQLLLFVATLSFIQHPKQVEGQLMNFGIVDKIRNNPQNTSQKTSRAISAFSVQLYDILPHGSNFELRRTDLDSDFF